MTLGEALIRLLEDYAVDTVFGIPGVHTIELYRGLARSSIRHVTPRHEQGAGFMADGYARASGKPGVAFVITGPGLTNALTAMAQARADSVPMLVVSGVNRTNTLGMGLGFLHELPDQQGLLAKLALASHRVVDGPGLEQALALAFDLFANGRPGPVHIEVPLDCMAKPCERLEAHSPAKQIPPDAAALTAAAGLLSGSRRPLILAGGGARRAEEQLERLARRLDAPVVTTTNGRGLLFHHPLGVPASPSLKSVRRLIGEVDAVLAVCTELGPTDYDMYADGGFVLPANLVRIDIDQAQLGRHPSTVSLRADASEALSGLLSLIPGRTPGEGASRAARTRDDAWAEIGEAMRQQVGIIETIRDALPKSLIVGDSTQPVYAGNLFYDHDAAGGWFNASTGFGALGYGPPAAIGAAIARPDRTVVCLTGDGGFQFTLPELGTAVDAGAKLVFVIWNNRGYREIETSMIDAGVEPVGVSPAPPDFAHIAAAYGLPFERVETGEGLAAALGRYAGEGPAMVEFVVA